MVPIVEGYKDRAAFGLRLDFSDPMSIHALDASATYTPGRGVPGDERVHLSAEYRHFEWTAEAKWNGASFYDLFGPTKVGRKGYSAGVTYKRALLNDAPRLLDATVGVTGYGGLEALPDAQNVSTSPGFDKLVTATAELSFRDVRASLGAVDAEKGYKWRLGVTTNLVRFERATGARWRGFPLATGTLDAGMPLPIRYSSLWLRGAAGYSPGDRDDPFANFFFGGFGNNWLDHQDPKRYRESESFPGAEIDGIGGTNFAKALLDWNLPPLRFRRVGSPSFYATWARASLFAGGLVTNMDLASDRRTVATLGVQADVRLTVLVQHPLTLSFGYARAFERNARWTDERMISLKIL
jgi:hypothetical protein